MRIFIPVVFLSVLGLALGLKADDLSDDSLVVDTYASQGYRPPVLKVWKAQITKRKVVPLVRVPVTDAELDAEEVTTLGQDTKAQYLFAPKDIPPLLEPDITFQPKEQIAIIGDSLVLHLENNGLGKSVLHFAVVEENGGRLEKRPTNELVVLPDKVDLLPGQHVEVSLSYVRTALDRERVFRIGIFDRDSEELGFARLTLQPKNGVARVAWTRDQDGVVFRNNGDISSRFIDVEICEKKCQKGGDIFLAPREEHRLVAPAGAAITLTQLVGGNKRRGTIPKFRQ